MVDSKPSNLFGGIDEISDFMPKISASGAVNQQQPANSPFCSWCDVEFGVFETKKHCAFCSRSVCKSCSINYPSAGKDARACDYCKLKQENPQINELLKCAYQWRCQDLAVLNTNIREVKSVNQKCEKEVAKVREGIMLAKASVERDANKVKQWMTDKEMDRV